MVDSGLNVIYSFISPYKAGRDMIRSLMSEGDFIEVFVNTPIEECTRRDPKGLYSEGKEAKIKNFTGINAPYEAPERPGNPAGDGRSPPGRTGRSDCQTPQESLRFLAVLSERLG